MTVCDKFQPTVLEGQLCYTLDVAKIAKIAENPTRPDKSYGLRLLLDPKPFQLSPADDDAKDFKVIVHTLAQHTKFGRGSYAMTTLKKMTGTESFKQLPDQQKKCRVHNRNKCQTQKYLEEVLEKCSCIPWPLQLNQVKKKQNIKK